MEAEPKPDAGADQPADSVPTADNGPVINRKPRFTIGKIMFWTAICAGGLVVVGATDDNMLYVVSVPLNLAVYLAVICGLVTIIRFPASLDSWIPLAAIPFLILLTFLYTLTEQGDQRQNFALLVMLIGAVYGIYLLVRNIKRIKGTGFSLAVAIYHLASLVGWMVWGFIMLIFSHGWD
jgi:hypothetical protein